MSAIAERPQQLDFDITDKSELERVASVNGLNPGLVRELSEWGILTVGNNGSYSLLVKRDDGRRVKIAYDPEKLQLETHVYTRQENSRGREIKKTQRREVIAHVEGMKVSFAQDPDNYEGDILVGLLLDGQEVAVITRSGKIVPDLRFDT